MATIHIRDLCVGNWVRYGRDYQVKAIDAAWDKLTLIGNNEQREETVWSISPIAISRKILEENGWECDTMYATKRIDEHISLDYYFHEHRLRKWYHGVDEWNNHSNINEVTFQAHCWYVHQLQNALRLAGVEVKINL